ncbi:MAG: CRTAC1 family protein [Bryobacteraceae bacterium]
MTAPLLVLALAAPAPFEDRSATSGITMVLSNSPTAEKHQIETMPGGVAAFDFDNDGLIDLFFANGAQQPDLRKVRPRDCNRLYRNRGARFEDVTERAGLCGEGYSNAVAAGDFDNDGFDDLFVAGVNRNILYRNRGDGTFEDVTEKAGVANRGRWAAGAGWFDYDNDGRLDLFVVHYVRWDPRTEPFCGDAKAGYRSYCHPKFYEGLSNALFHNNGDGTFTDVSAASGIARHIGKGMGVAFADYDGDGRIDIFVANDTVPNFLFRNRGGGQFEEVAFPAGVAMNEDGRALSSMGADFRPFRGVRPALFITALVNETFPLFLNRGGGLFSDSTYQSGVGRATIAYSGWGAGIFDFDNDGRQDLFAACGDVQTNAEAYSSRKSRQPNLLLRATPSGTFEGQDVGSPAFHRGAAFADFDNDGRIDVAVTRLGETPLLLRNMMGSGNHWIGFRLEGRQSNRDAIGARVRLLTAEGQQWNHVTTSAGYASSSQKAVHFGLGSNSRVTSVEILWSSGVRTKIDQPAADRYHSVRE